MKKLFISAILILTLATIFSAPAKADGFTIGASFGSGGGGAGILTFFGIGGMSCYSQPETSCDDDPKNGLFNSIACRVMKSFNGSVVPLYCNIIANPVYLQAVNAMMVLYVIFLGVGFLSGLTPVEISVVIARVLKAVFVYTFAINADVYFAIVYNTVLSTPENIVRILLSTTQPGGGTDITSGGAGNGVAQNFFQYVDQGIYHLFSEVAKPAYNEASGASYGKSHLKVVIMGLALWQVGGDLVGGLFMGVVFGWLIAYFGIMIRISFSAAIFNVFIAIRTIIYPIIFIRKNQGLNHELDKVDDKLHCPDYAGGCIRVISKPFLR